MSDTPPDTTTTVTATAGATPPPAAVVAPRTAREALAALLEAQFILSMALIILAARILDSLLRNGSEAIQNQILMVAISIVSLVGGAYLSANLGKAGSGGTTATATTAPTTQGTKP